MRALVCCFFFYVICGVADDEVDEPVDSLFLLQSARDLQGKAALLPTQQRSRPLHPSIGAAIFTARTSYSRRALIRGMWKHAGESSPIEYKFVLCNNVSSFNASEAEMLAREATAFGDLLFLDCEEGYDLLTEKTLTCLQAFHDTFSDLDLFMKVDDDTFVAWSRFYPFVVQNWVEYGSAVYMGVMLAPVPPNRSSSNKFNEKWEAYPRNLWPKSAAGGPGYILGREIVAKVLEESKQWQRKTGMLVRNEDKAVAVFVEEVNNHSTPIQYINVPGTEGYDWDSYKQTKCGVWNDYPYILTHNMTGQEISCLWKLEAAGNSDAVIDGCFPDVDCSWYCRGGDCAAKQLPTDSSVPEVRVKGMLHE
jgi:hypothetical protein